MKITPNLNYQKVESSKPQVGRTYAVSKDKVSFSSAASLAKGGVSKFFNGIEKGGFLADFLVIDAISMIIPRIWIGLGRDKKETGKVNYKAGAEEAGREILSGPSMFAIPAFMLAGARRINSASKVTRETLPHFTRLMNETVDSAEKISDFAETKKLNQALGEKIFDTAFKDHDLKDVKFKEVVSKTKKGITYNEITLATKNDAKAKFVEILQKGDDKKTVKELERFVSTLYNQNSKQNTASLLDTKALFNIIAADKPIKVNDLVSDFHNYTKDVSKNIAKKDFIKDVAVKAKAGAKTFVEELGKSREVLRRATSIASFFAVGAFLVYIPKLYQRSNKSPAEVSAELAARGGAKKGVTNENK